MCSFNKEELISYLDGTLEESEYKKLKAHIENCIECQKELGYLRKSIDLLEDYNRNINVPIDFVANVNEKILLDKDLNARIAKGSRRLSAGLLVASLIVVLMVTTFAYETFDFINWWKSNSLKESTVIEELINMGYGDIIEESVVDNDIKITINSVVADDLNTLVLITVEDLKGDKKYIPGYTAEETLIKGSFIGRYSNHLSSAKRRDYRWGYTLYNEDDNITKRILYLYPIYPKMDTIYISFNKLYTLDEFYVTDFKEIPVEGNWSFEIPVKKYKAEKYRIDEEIFIDGNLVLVEEIIIAPTVTKLIYRYKENQGHGYLLENIMNISLIGKGIEYKGKMGGITVGQNTRRVEIDFEPMYFNRPKNLSIKFDGYTRRMIEDAFATFKLDLEKSFPQSLDYMGNTITVESVRMIDEELIISLKDSQDKELYQSLDFEIYHLDIPLLTVIEGNDVIYDYKSYYKTSYTIKSSLRNLKEDYGLDPSDKTTFTIHIRGYNQYIDAGGTYKFKLSDK